MTVYWKFDSYEDREEIARMNKALDMCGAIFEFQEYLRFKHLPKDPKADEIRTKFYELLNEKGIVIDELYS